jgi:hypothetical protein
MFRKIALRIMLQIYVKYHLYRGWKFRLEILSENFVLQFVNL